MKKRNSIATNIVWNWGSQATRFIFSIVVIKLLLHRLGNDNYGMWVLVGSIIGYYQLFEMGTGTALTRYLSRAYGKNDNRELTEYFSAAIALFLLLGTAIVILTAILSFIPARLFHISPENAESFRLLILLCGLTIAISFSANPFQTMLRAVERYDYINQITMLGSVLRLVLIALLLNQSVVVLGLITLGIQCILVSLSVVATFRALGRIPFAKNAIRRQCFTSIFSFSIYSFIIVLADMIRFKTDAIVISSFISIGLISFFHIGNRLLDIVRELSSHISSPFVPRFSSEEVRSGIDKVNRMFAQATRITSFFSAVCIAGAVGSGRQFIQLWVGSSLNDSFMAYNVLIILALPAFFDTCQTISISYLYSTFHHKVMAVMTSFEAIANLALSLILVRPCGIYGVALGTAIPMLLTRGFVLPVYVGRLTGRRFFPFYFSSLIHPLLICSCSVILQYLGYRFLPGTNIICIAIIFGGATLIVLPIAFFTYFTGDEREWIVRYLREWTGRKKK
jgi:O-antigen/teichoic acid export membrane protein